MQKTATLTENEVKTLDKIADILLEAKFDTEEIAHANEPDEDGDIEEMTEADIKRRAKYLHYWLDRAEDALHAMLYNQYDHKKHNLHDYELPK